MDSLVKADWVELIQVGGFIAAGWYVGNEAVRVVWRVVYDLGLKAWEKARPQGE